VLTISDLHIPFHHPKALTFLKAVKKEFRCDRIVCIGDEMDMCSLSFFDKDPNMPGPHEELQWALKEIKQFYTAFPKVQVCISNHTSRPFRRAFKFGLPSHFLRSYKEFMQAPQGWSWHEEIDIDGCLYIHGDNFSGKFAAMKAAESHRQSTIIGHVHAFGGVNYMACRNDLIFGMNVGCLIDHKEMAFNYSRKLPSKPTLGCGVIIEGQKAIFIPMDLGFRKGGRKS